MILWRDKQETNYHKCCIPRGHLRTPSPGETEALITWTGLQSRSAVMEREGCWFNAAQIYDLLGLRRVSCKAAICRYYLYKLTLVLCFTKMQEAKEMSFMCPYVTRCMLNWLDLISVAIAISKSPTAVNRGGGSHKHTEGALWILNASLSWAAFPLRGLLRVQERGTKTRSMTAISSIRDQCRH